MKILVVEDEQGLREALMESLRASDYLVDGTGDGESGLDMIRGNSYDLIILDIMLPGLNGMDLLTIIRKLNITVPVILLTALSQLEYKVQGMDSGADDYITKPFEMKELLARIRMIMRRNTSGFDPGNSTLTMGSLELNTLDFTISCTGSGRNMQLSKKEFHMLEYFMRNPGQVLSREQITLRVWGYDSETEYNNVDVYISYLRKKLMFVRSDAQIVAVRGIGYKLEEGSRND